MPNAYSYCPSCGKAGPAADARGVLRCAACGWRDYGNPVPVVCALVARRGAGGPEVLLVRRRVAPQAGGWCLPCGFVGRGEDPAAAAARETLEEAGLRVRVGRVLSVSTPSAAANELLVAYLAAPAGDGPAAGEPTAGDDAGDAAFFGERDRPPACFPAHEELIRRWFAEQRGGGDRDPFGEER